MPDIYEPRFTAQKPQKAEFENLFSNFYPLLTPISVLMRYAAGISEPRFTAQKPQKAEFENLFSNTI